MLLYLTRVIRCVVNMHSPFSASGKDVPALFPLRTVGAPGHGCAAEDAQNPAWPEEQKVKGQRAEKQAVNLKFPSRLVLKYIQNTLQ